jgi:hypothetical protein
MSNCPWKVNRIVIDPYGYAVPPTSAVVVSIDTAFKREDGWTLAAPANLVRVAFYLWPTEWRYFWTRDDGKVRRIDEFSPDLLQGQLKRPRELNEDALMNSEGSLYR